MANGYDLASEAMQKKQGKKAAESPATPAKPVREGMWRPPVGPPPVATPGPPTEGDRLAMGAAMNGTSVEDFAKLKTGAFYEATGNQRSDGEASQHRDGSNRYDISTPEKKRKALAAARRSGNPDDLKKLRGKVAESALAPQRYPREAVSSGEMPNLGEAPLNAKKRNKLPAQVFAGPDRSYPIDTPERARSALARVKANGSPELQRRVIAAVKKKYPSMDVETTSKKPSK